MAAYEITEPPRGTRCASIWCVHAAAVRVVVPAEAASHPGGDDLPPAVSPAEGRCGLCWDVLRGRLIGAGHTVTDRTGSLEGIRAEFPGFSVFRSDEGVLYASSNGRTYDGYLISQLRSRLRQVSGAVTEQVLQPSQAGREHPGRIWERSYPGNVDQVRHVRAALRPLLSDCPMAGDVILITSELAANAALHSYSGLPGGTFTVRAIVRPGEHIQVEVEDGGGPWSPGLADPSRSHGLDIIGAIAAEWNVRGDNCGRTAWARLDWPAPASHDDADGQHGRPARADIESGRPGDLPAVAIPDAGTGPDVAPVPAGGPYR